MPEEQPDQFRFGRTIALAGVVFVISLAILTLTLLALNLLPNLVPILYPASNSLLYSRDHSLITLTQEPMVEPESNPSNPIYAAIYTAQQAWVNGNADEFADLFTETGEFVVPGHVYRGRDAIRDVTAEFSQTHNNVQIDIHRIISEGSQAVVEWQWQDTDIASGKRTVADDAIVVDFEADLIKRWREYIDATSSSLG
ncbi:MAG: nuclear transport factor 2 family protein [Leptolyngbya sp. IPPAS B-1204]|nr:nuclear transport factor 2 family protein [Leptolyngbya sp. NK1-12]